MNVYQKILFPLNFRIVIISIFSLFLSSFSLADDDRWEDDGWGDRYDNYVAPTPSGYDKYITFMANGVYESFDGSILLDGLIDGDGMNFQRNVMGRSNKRIKKWKRKALRFFKKRYGVDPINDTDNFYFTGYQIDPRLDYRAFTVSGERISADGREVFDGGYVALVTNPDGVTLGGEFEGVHVPEGAQLVFGEYKVVGADGEDPIYMRYRSIQPALGGLIRCEFFSPKYGKGLGGGTNDSSVGDDGLMRGSVKLVVTFSAHGN